jgi:hypothetical protein
MQVGDMCIYYHLLLNGTIMKPSTLPSLNLSSMLLDTPLSQDGYAHWHVSHAATDIGTVASLPNLPISEDFGMILKLPTNNDMSVAVLIPNADDGMTREFSFRNAWEDTRQMQHLPFGARHMMARWNRRLDQEGLSMDAGTRAPRNAMKPPAFQTHFRERHGLVRHNGRLCRCPSSSWTSHAGLDSRIRWAD